MRETSRQGCGFLLLPSAPRCGYKGIDRHLFMPSLASDHNAPLLSVGDSPASLWRAQPTEWLREACRLYETNMLEVVEDDLWFIDAAAVAQRIRAIIEPHLGHHEVMECEMVPLVGNARVDGKPKGYGYDVAYQGGDLYSAVLNGLLCNPHPILFTRYRSQLNASGLFDHLSSAAEYAAEFRHSVPSEVSSDFVAYHLSPL